MIGQNKENMSKIYYKSKNIVVSQMKYEVCYVCVLKAGKHVEIHQNVSEMK